MEDSTPGRALLRSDLSDSSAEASAQVDTEERAYRPTPDPAHSPGGAEDRHREKSRAAREAIGRRSEHGEHGEHDEQLVQEPEQVLAGAGAAHPGGRGVDPVAAPEASRHQVVWGPDAHTTGSQPPVREGPDKPGALAMRLAALVALLVVIVVGVMLAFDLGSTRTAVDLVPDDEESSSTPVETEPVTIGQVQDFDPSAQGGNGEENPDDTGNTIDGDPQTSWRTQTYFDGPVLAPYKEGVGLLVDLEDEREVREVDLQLVGQGYDVTLFAADPGAPAPEDIAGLTKVGRERGSLEEVTFESEGTNTRYLVIWFRSLPQVSGGYAGEVSEIVVRS